ncbi:MAG: cupin domain-containing protein [Candidatus Dormiibacterota bacterium]
MSNYFSDSGSAVDTPATWVTVDDVAALDMGPGLAFRPTVGQNLLVNVVDFAANTHAPRHYHDEEQACYVLQGELDFEISGERRRVGAGSIVVIPPNAPHEVWSHESGAKVIDIFSPPRQALLEIVRAQRG